MRKINLKHSDNSGVITIEALIVGISFMFIMLFLCGFFVVYMAQSKVADVAVKATQSLANETYLINQYSNDAAANNGLVCQSISEALVTHFFDFDINTKNKDKFSVSKFDKWWEQGDIGDVIKSRYIGYLANGDKDKADGILEGLNVVNGLDGLDFSESYVDGNEVLHVIIKYEIKYTFDIANFGKRATKETVCAQLWLDGSKGNRTAGANVASSSGSTGGSSESGSQSSPQSEAVGGQSDTANTPKPPPDEKIDWEKVK